MNFVAQTRGLGRRERCDAAPCAVADAAMVGPSRRREGCPDEPAPFQIRAVVGLSILLGVFVSSALFFIR
jgi:hypothetical protein